MLNNKLFQCVKQYVISINNKLFQYVNQFLVSVLVQTKVYYKEGYDETITFI